MKRVCRHASNMNMSLDRFFKPQQLPMLTAQETDLSLRVVEEANKAVKKVTSPNTGKENDKQKRKYTTIYFTAEDRACIGRYASENGNFAGVKKFKAKF